MTLPNIDDRDADPEAGTSSVYFIGSRSGVGAAAFAAAATAMTLSMLITRSATRIVLIA